MQNAIDFHVLAVHQAMNNGKGVFGTTSVCYAADIRFDIPAFGGGTDGALREVSPSRFHPLAYRHNSSVREWLI